MVHGKEEQWAVCGACVKEQGQELWDIYVFLSEPHPSVSTEGGAGRQSSRGGAGRSQRAWRLPRGSGLVLKVLRT